MPRLSPCLFVLMLAAPALAQEALPPNRFESLSQGHTLHFTVEGQPFGDEQYFAGRRSLWRYSDGTCATGRWWGRGNEICFRYDPDTGDQCWRFTEHPGGFAAELVEGASTTGFVLEMSHRDEAPLSCPGPDIGT